LRQVKKTDFYCFYSKRLVLGLKSRIIFCFPGCFFCAEFPGRIILRFMIDPVPGQNQSNRIARDFLTAKSKQLPTKSSGFQRLAPRWASLTPIVVGYCGVRLVWNLIFRLALDNRLALIMSKSRKRAAAIAKSSQRSHFLEISNE
ncbi:MAG: hypothetical protein ACYSUX_18185, partial [Planctomycetota bacterium]